VEIVYVGLFVYLFSVELTLLQTVPYDLLERGYTNQVCIDFSTVVVESMKARHADKPQVQWQVGDVRDMKDIETKSVDVAFDKGTMDAMIHGSPWSPPDEVLENTGRYINEVRMKNDREMGSQKISADLE
jgi:hypothetical protein